MNQHLIIVGLPYLCDREGCATPAAIVLREQGVDEDGMGGVCGIAYCAKHWADARSALVPLESFTPDDVVREASRLTRNTNDEQPA